MDYRTAMKRFNEIAGWMDQTVATERSKKLTVAAAEGFGEKITSLRDLFATLCMENGRLLGANGACEKDLKEILIEGN